MSRSTIRRTAALTLAALALTGATVAGCSGGTSGGGSSGSTPGSTSGGAEPAERMAAPEAAPTAAASGSDGSRTGDRTLPSTAISPAAGRLLTRTGSMQITAGDAAAVAARATTQVDALGGYETSASSDVPADGTGGSVGTVVRETYAIPSARFDEFRTFARKLGKVSDETVRSTDVTDTVVDLSSRIATQKQSLARIRALFAKATDIGDITSLEGQLTTREADLESMQSRLAATRAQVAMSTLNVTFSSVPPVVKAAHHQPGFVSGLRAGWHGLVVAAVAVSHVVGALLPFLVPLAVLVALGTVVARRLRRGRTGAPTPPAPPAGAAGA